MEFREPGRQTTGGGRFTCRHDGMAGHPAFRQPKRLLQGARQRFRGVEDQVTNRCRHLVADPNRDDPIRSELLRGMEP